MNELRNPLTTPTTPQKEFTTEYTEKKEHTENTEPYHASFLLCLLKTTQPTAPRTNNELHK